MGLNFAFDIGLIIRFNIGFISRVADSGLTTRVAERVLELPGSHTGLARCGGDWWTGGGGR